MLKELSDIVKNDREAFIQLLLSTCDEVTFNRIKHCPNFPLPRKTSDLGYRQNLLKRIVDSNSIFEIPAIFAILYESAIPSKYRKAHGQYFTPPKIAGDAFRDLALKNGEVILDAGCGTGTFAASILKRLEEDSKNVAAVNYIGVENDAILALASALTLDLINAPKDWQIVYANFLLFTPDVKINTVISNPPFVRFHRLNTKKRICTKLGISSFSGLHSFFVAHSAKTLRPKKMLFILPPEMFGTNYGRSLLTELSGFYRITKKALCYNNESKIYEIVEKKPNTFEKEKAVIVSFEFLPNPINNGNSKPITKSSGIKLGEFAAVHRGISTGANSFFVMNDVSVKELGVPSNFLLKVMPTKIKRKFIPNTFDESDWDTLRNLQKPCWLLRIPAHPDGTSRIPNKVLEYLKKGERLGIHLTPTCLTRKPWYSVRSPTKCPDFFFTYFSRKYPKFIYNKAKVYNLTNLLGVYLKLPKKYSDDGMNKIAVMLNANIKTWIDTQFAGRIYCGGLIKFEPKNLQELPISKSLQQFLGIQPLQFSFDRE